MKVTIKLFAFLMPLFFILNCSKDDTPKQVPLLSDIIIGQWHHTKYMGWPKNPENEWHIQEDSTLVLHFKSNGNILYRYPNTGEVINGTFEVIDSSSTVNISLAPEFNTFPYHLFISEFTEDMIIREIHVDEGFIHERYDKLE